MSPGKALQTNIFSQFLALLYKELLFRKCHYIGTSFEIIFPIIVATIPCMIYNGFYEDFSQRRPEFQKINFTTYDPLDPMDMYGGSWEDLEFVYAPSNEMTDEFMDDSIRNFFANYYQPYLKNPKKMSSEEELEKYILDEQKMDERKMMIGTVFKGFDTGSSNHDLPNDLDYKVYYTREFETRRRYVLNGPNTYPDYRQTFFIQWQTAVGDAFIRQKSIENSKDIKYKIYLQAFPYPEYKQTSVETTLLDAVFFINMALIFFVGAIVKRIIEDKTDGSKELLETMGMTRSPYWASIFTNNFIIAFTFTLIMSIVYKTSLKSVELKIQSSFLLLLIILLLFMANIILFSMTISIFFNRVAYGVFAIMMVHLLSIRLLVWLFYSTKAFEDYFSLSLFHKLCVCVHPSGALITFFVILELFESGNVGIQWRNLIEYPMIPDINMAMVIGMMIFSCFLYIFAIWYFDAVWPWQPGVRKPLYFLFMKSYWSGQSPFVSNEIELEGNANSVGNFEEEPRGALKSVDIKGLSKVIQRGRSSKVVLNDVSLKCYLGQITILVGSNEVGKTSLFNILAGKELPTKGSASITGLDISTNMHRKLLGICSQRNILYEEFSVEEHLKMYAAMKGTSLRYLSYEADQVLNSFKLSDRRFETVSNLSYAEKRKLSLAIAIVGGSKILLLDEPTYGMDAESKKHVWDALLAIKQDCTVIVTTQSFEEADILGDRIAVMADGEIKSCGTPTFIKQKLGAGYHLHVTKDTNFDLQGLKSLVEKNVSTATCENESPKEVSFNLGSANELGDLFEQLDSRKAELGIISYGVSLSTIRDALVSVSNTSHMKHSLSTDFTTENTASETEDVRRDTFHPSPHASLPYQFRALLLKNLHYSKRRWKFHLIQLVIPFILMLMCFTYMKLSMRSPYPPLKFDISSVYGATDGFYYDAGTDYTTTLWDLAQTFKSVLKSNDVSVEKVSEPTHYVLNYGNKGLARYLKRLVVGGAFDYLPGKTDVVFNLTAWYNAGSYHSMPVSLLLMQTALLRQVSNTGTISLTLEPVISLRERYENIGFYRYGAWFAQFLMPMIFTFLSLSFVMIPVRERVTGAKLLQLMSGVPAAVYWIANFLWDCFIYYVISGFLILVPIIFFPSVFASKHMEAVGTLIVLFFLYGWASLPLGYIVSILVKRENRGLFIFIGLCLLFSVIILFTLGSLGLYLFIKYRNDTPGLEGAYWLFRLFPVCSITMGIQTNFNLAFNNVACDIFTPIDLLRCASASPDKSPTLVSCCKSICNQQLGNIRVGCHETMKHLSLQKKHNTYASNGPEALVLGLEGIIFFAVLFLLETRTAAKIANIINLHLERIWDQIDRVVLRRTHQVLRQENLINDPQVLREEERVRNLASTQGGAAGEALVVLGLTKNVRTLSVVNRLTFGINRGEYFGILGANGAGKTSMFGMLTGVDSPSEGNAFIQSDSLKKFRSHIGYCPEADSLLEDLSGREMLLLFGQLRGLRGYYLQKNVNDLIQSLGLANCADEQTQFYSGGDKRKLSVAIALVGCPPVILLDEPTARVGPESCRQIWKALDRVGKTTKASILLSTQSIEESEALCNRLAIMVDGRFRCLGSLDQLKSRQGQGYTLTIKISKQDRHNSERVNALKNHIANSLQNATLTDEYQGTLQYQVMDPSTTVGQLFNSMSDVKAQFEVEDFSIGASSLEQIFLGCSRA